METKTNNRWQNAYKWCPKHRGVWVALTSRGTYEDNQYRYLTVHKLTGLRRGDDIVKGKKICPKCSDKKQFTPTGLPVDKIVWVLDG